MKEAIIETQLKCGKADRTHYSEFGCDNSVASGGLKNVLVAKSERNC
jgi:hypothetical protein